MQSTRWLGAGLITLGAAVAAGALLGPFGLEVIHYRTSATTLNQIIGGDAAALLLVAPAAILVGLLAWRRHPAAPVLALAPASFAVYTATQLIVGQEYLRLPGNNERFFPLLLGIFLLGGAVALGAWSGIDPTRLPATSRRLDRMAGGLLLAVAAFIVFGLHLPTYIDAMRDTPTGVQYVSSPTPFWLVKLMDLGIVVPVALVTAVGLLRGALWARKPMYALAGGYALLGAAVAGMAITMWLNHDPDSSLGMVVASTSAAVTVAALAGLLYRPLLRSRRRRPVAPEVGLAGRTPAAMR
jgi:hypothetical protein